MKAGFSKDSLSKSMIDIILSSIETVDDLPDVSSVLCRYVCLSASLSMMSIVCVTLSLSLSLSLFLFPF
jgi:hypothetical protein